MRNYNFIRPIMLVLIALLTRSLVFNLSMLAGLDQGTAESLAVAGMVVAALIVFRRFQNLNKNKRTNKPNKPRD